MLFSSQVSSLRCWSFLRTPKKTQLELITRHWQQKMQLSKPSYLADPGCNKPETSSPVTAALWSNYMHSSIMYGLHIVSILVDVNNPVKYSVYRSTVGEVCWDAEVMKCYFLPLSLLLALFPLFCRWSGTVVSAVLLIPGLNKLGRQAWICLNHPLPLPVPRRANNLPWVDTDDGKRHSRTSEKQRGALDKDIIILSLIKGR